MDFYVHLRQEPLNNLIIIVTTNRINFNEQLHTQFSKCADFLDKYQCKPKSNHI